MDYLPESIPAFDNQSPHTLKDEQVAILAAVVLEEFGRH
jgi:hypothetical protein